MRHRKLIFHPLAYPRPLRTLGAGREYRHILLIFIAGIWIFLGGSLAHPVTAASLSLGTGLWQEQRNYINTFELGIRQDFSRFSYELEIPLFLPFESDPFIFGIPNEEETSIYQSLSERWFISGFVKEALYHDENIRVGLERRTFHFQEPSIWGNPLFHPNTPFLGPNFYLETAHIALYTSAIQDPSLILITGNTKLFNNPKERQKPLWLKEFEIKPMLYTDLYLMNSLEPRWGASLDLKTTYWEYEKHTLGLETGFFYGHELFRSFMAFLYRFATTGTGDLQAGIGPLFQDKNHTPSALLSSLYPALREEISPSSGEYIWGGAAFLRVNPEGAHYFDINVDFYDSDERIFSYRASYGFQWEKVRLGLSYMRNEIKSFDQLAKSRTKTSFFSLDFKALILEGLFDIGWSAYLDWSGQSTFKSRFYIHLLF